MTAIYSPDTTANGARTRHELTDGHHLIVDALKLNDVRTIYGLVGIPITDLARIAQASGIRYIGFRHESDAVHAAAAAGFLTKKPGVCLTVSGPGFLNGLVALANATTNCIPVVQISGSSERHIVDLKRGDYEELDQMTAAERFAKAAYRVDRAEDIGRGIARAIRTAVSGRPGGVYLDIPAAVLGEVTDADKGRKSLWRVVDPAPRQLPDPEAVNRAVTLLAGAQRPLVVLGKGAAYAQAASSTFYLSEYPQYPNGAFGDTGPRGGNAGGGGQPGWVLKCKGWETDPNAYIYFTIQEQNWERTCEAIERPEWVDDPAYRTAEARQPQIFEIFDEIEKWLADKTKYEAVDILRKYEVPCAPVLSMKEIAYDPALRASGSVVEVQHKERGTYLTVGSPIKFCEFTPEIAASPLLGQHTDDVLAELGYDADTVDALHTKGVV